MSLERQAVPSDGNCIFSASIQQLRNQYASFSYDYKQYLASIEIDFPLQNSELATKLRQLALDEIAKNRVDYISFMAHDDLNEFDQLIFRYRTTSKFSGTFGDLLLPAVSNVLSSSICLVISHLQKPQQCCNARNVRNNISCISLIPATDHAIASVVRKGKLTTKHGAPKSKVCHCGRSGNKNIHPCANSRLCPCNSSGTPCSLNPKCLCLNCSNPYGWHDSDKTLKHTKCRCRINNPGSESCQKRRCPCFVNANGCGNQCGCHSCKNSYGIRRPHDTEGLAQPKPPPSRRKLVYQSQGKLRRLSGTSYLENKGEAIRGSKWMRSEGITLAEIIKQIKPLNLGKN